MAAMDKVAQFVADHEGDTPIRKILIANNGIGAVKAIRSMRKWAYETLGEEGLIRFVVMATPEDALANAEFIRMADEVAEVPGGANNNNYANVELIVELAEHHAVDAVWAGASLLAPPRRAAATLRCSHCSPPPALTRSFPPLRPIQSLQAGATPPSTRSCRPGSRSSRNASRLPVATTRSACSSPPQSGTSPRPGAC